MDPHLEEMPDHAGPFYQAIRDVLIQNGMPAEQAIQVLDNSWNLNHDAHILASDVPAWLGLKAMALAWPETALAFARAGPGTEYY